MTVSKIRLDLNNPVFQEQLFNLPKEQQNICAVFAAKDFRYDMESGVSGFRAEMGSHFIMFRPSWRKTLHFAAGERIQSGNIPG